MNKKIILFLSVLGTLFNSNNMLYAKTEKSLPKAGISTIGFAMATGWTVGFGCLIHKNISTRKSDELPMLIPGLIVASYASYRLGKNTLKYLGLLNKKITTQQEKTNKLGDI